MRRIARTFSRLMLAGCFVCAGGCAIAALIDKTNEPHEAARYSPPHENLLVLVEDYQNPALVEDLVDHIDQLVGEELIANHVAPVVNPERLTLMRLDHTDEYKKMKIASIGDRLGARQIIYADVTEFSVASAAGVDAMKGHAEARVKVVDCVTGATRWPTDAASAGYPIVVDIPFTADSRNVSTPVVRQALSRALASRIARLFYNAPIEQPDPAPRYPETDLR